MTILTSVRIFRDRLAAGLIWGVALTPGTTLKTRVVHRVCLALATILSGCVGSAPDATCAFSASARYTMTAEKAEPQTNTLVCLFGGERCAESTYTCEGEAFTFKNPRFPDDSYSFTVVQSTPDGGMDVDFRDLTAKSTLRVHLIED